MMRTLSLFVFGGELALNVSGISLLAPNEGAKSATSVAGVEEEFLEVDADAAEENAVGDHAPVASGTDAAKHLANTVAAGAKVFKDAKVFEEGAKVFKEHAEEVAKPDAQGIVEPEAVQIKTIADKVNDAAKMVQNRLSDKPPR